jgi:hypothetical protein
VVDKFVSGGRLLEAMGAMLAQNTGGDHGARALFRHILSREDGRVRSAAHLTGGQSCYGPDLTYVEKVVSSDVCGEGAARLLARAPFTARLLAPPPPAASAAEREVYKTSALRVLSALHDVLQVRHATRHVTQHRTAWLDLG